VGPPLTPALVREVKKFARMLAVRTRYWDVESVESQALWELYLLWRSYDPNGGAPWTAYVWTFLPKWLPYKIAHMRKRVSARRDWNSMAHENMVGSLNGNAETVTYAHELAASLLCYGTRGESLWLKKNVLGHTVNELGKSRGVSKQAISEVILKYQVKLDTRK